MVLSQLKKVIRPMYSSPPLHGARIASRILSDPALKSSWLAELKDMASRIQRVREALRKGLESKGTPGQWKHITDQIGMFSYTGLTRKSRIYLRNCFCKEEKKRGGGRESERRKQKQRRTERRARGNVACVPCFFSLAGRARDLSRQEFHSLLRSKQHAEVHTPRQRESVCTRAYLQ